jgi:nucleotide-binding universal stress UspA family protein
MLCVRILTVVSQLPPDEKVIEISSAIAHRTQSTITLVHIISSEEDHPTGENVLHQTQRLLPDLPVETLLIKGKLVKRILAETHKGDYDLLIVDANIGAKPNQQPLSAQARALVRRAPISVMVVRQSVSKMKSVLICTGGMHLSEPIIEASAQLASASGAEVSLLHVAGAVPSMYTGLEEIEETLTELLSTETPIAQHLRTSAMVLDQHNVPSHLILRHGVVSEEILREVSLYDYDLIITDPLDNSLGFLRLFLGDVVEDIIRYTSCPFLVVTKPLN